MSNGQALREFAWDTPISDVINAIFTLSADLLGVQPRILLDANRLQVNWQQSGLADPAAQSIIFITFAARPVAPSTIVINQAGLAAAAPTLATLNPTSAPSGAAVTLTLTGTGFDAGATVNIGTAYGLVPSSVTPTDLSVLVQAVNVAAPGTLEVSVTNGDGQLSNALTLTLT